MIKIGCMKFFKMNRFYSAGFIFDIASMHRPNTINWLWQLSYISPGQFGRARFRFARHPIMTELFIALPLLGGLKFRRVSDPIARRNIKW